MSTAYSGSTAISASATSASPADTSVSATSDAQVSNVAAANTPSPKISASITFGMSGCAMPGTSKRRRTGAGAAAAAVAAMIAHCRKPAGGFVALRSSSERIYAPVYRRGLILRTFLCTSPSFDNLVGERYTRLTPCGAACGSARVRAMPESNGSKSKSDWLEKTYAKSVAKAPERDYPFDTSDGALVEPLYAPEDMDGWDYLSQLSFPGEFPYTRGVQPTMYRGRLWTMRQYAGFGDAEESNARYRYLLQQGQTGLSVAFDLPTQIGYDSDHPMATGEVGKVGVAISSLADMELLMKEIPLEKATTSMTINATGSILLAFYVAVAKKQGSDLSKIGGTTQNDILKEYIARGTYIFPPEGSMRLITDVFGWCKDNLPSWNTISISGYHMREAGCTSIQEVAFTFANAIAYVEAALKAG